jgi:hypothetical protein
MNASRGRETSKPLYDDPDPAMEKHMTLNYHVRQTACVETLCDAFEQLLKH